MERSGSGSRQRRASSTLQKVRLGDCNVGARDHICNGNVMDLETRSREEIPTGSPLGVKARLKDCSHALTTSKELLKIMNRMWAQEDRLSSSISIVSALNSELERARLQVDYLIHVHKPEHSDVRYLVKRFAEEKAAWKSDEQEVVEAAIGSVAGELEVERKMRRRFESLNKKLGKELAETKSDLVKAVNEMEDEKRARLMVEKICDELARDISEDKAEVEELKRDTLKVEREREKLKLADEFREKGAQMKLSEAKHQLEEKTEAVDKLRNQLQTYLKAKRCKDKTLEQSHTQLHNIEAGGLKCGNKEDSVESDLHSIELNTDNKRYKTQSLQRRISDWIVQSENIQKGGDRRLDRGRRYNDIEPKWYIDETQAYIN